MCIFSARVRSVTGTNIFARLSDRGTQFLVYSMCYSADQPVAMILPFPVLPPAQNRALRFLNFKGYPDFFEDLRSGFVEPNPAGGIRTGSTAGTSRPLPVENVGDYIASYVPTLDDFSRLDSQFTLPQSTWDKIPEYKDYGFAVFQLRPSTRSAARVHPMAVEFYTRLDDTLFFPTVHVHDGIVHPREHFDHNLYFQTPGRQPGNAYLTSTGFANLFMAIPKTQGTVDESQRCYRKSLYGELPNNDTLIRVA